MALILNVTKEDFAKMMEGAEVMEKEKKNYVVEFMKNRGNIQYEKFFKVENVSSVTAAEKAVKEAIERLEQERHKLNLAYEAVYSSMYVACKKSLLLHFCDKNKKNYYYDKGGVKVDIDDENKNRYNVLSLSLKVETIYVVQGYCYDLASVIVKSYACRVSQDCNSCKLREDNEFIVPFFDEMIVARSGACYSEEEKAKEALNYVNAGEFLNGFYGIERQCPMTLGDARFYAKNNPAFEVIIKTAPESIMKTLLADNGITKSGPIHKLLGLTEEIYKKAIDKNIIADFVNLLDYIRAKDIFNKTEEEWIETILATKEGQNELDFNKVEYTGYGYTPYRYSQNSTIMKSKYISEESPLLTYFCWQYTIVEEFRKYYSFSKFCNYVIEECVNQAFPNVRHFVEELRDYLRMCDGQGAKPILYTSYLTITHNIASRNHKVFLDEHQEEIFKNRYFGFKTIKVTVNGTDYYVLAPKNSDEVKAEGDHLNHCVASYIKRILDGETKIFFLRKNEKVSLITIEVQNGRICQARGACNRAPEKEEEEAIKKFAEKLSLTCAY